MTVSDRWLLPDGVDELLPPEAWKVELLRRNLLDTYSRYGYELISPPLIEYLDSLLTGTGNDLDLQTFKLTDQLTGRMMGVRADITPQVARIDTHLLKGVSVNRLCYVDTVLHTRPAHMLTNRSPLQIGCELFGEAGVAADIEVIALMLETLYLSGIQKVHIDLAHVGIYQGLIESSALGKSVESRVFDALSRKSIPELDVLAQDMPENADTINVIRDIANLSGGPDALDKIRQNVSALTQSSAEIVLAALDELQNVSRQIQTRFTDIEIGFDFCELRGYSYHTGVMFAAYTPAYGHALAKGGRYNDVGKDFGESRPATGFSADLKTLVRVAGDESQADSEHAVDTGIVSVLAPAGNSDALLKEIALLRKIHRVVQLLSESETTETYGCSHRLIYKAEQWQLEKI